MINANLSLDTVSGSCDAASFLDHFSFTPVKKDLPTGAAISPGSVTIYVNVYDLVGDIVKSKEFRDPDV
ncbi:MAG: hypothetical protein HRF40_06755 [Nitrososphaera sp.]